MSLDSLFGYERIKANFFYDDSIDDMKDDVFGTIITTFIKYLKVPATYVYGFTNSRNYYTFLVNNLDFKDFLNEKDITEDEFINSINSWHSSFVINGKNVEFDSEFLCSIIRFDNDIEFRFNLFFVL